MRGRAKLEQCLCVHTPTAISLHKRELQQLASFSEKQLRWTNGNIVMQHVGFVLFVYGYGLIFSLFFPSPSPPTPKVWDFLHFWNTRRLFLKKQYNVHKQDQEGKMSCSGMIIGAPSHKTNFLYTKYYWVGNCVCHTHACSVALHCIICQWGIWKRCICTHWVWQCVHGAAA